MTWNIDRNVVELLENNVENKFNIFCDIKVEIES